MKLQPYDVLQSRSHPKPQDSQRFLASPCHHTDYFFQNRMQNWFQNKGGCDQSIIWRYYLTKPSWLKESISRIATEYFLLLLSSEVFASLGISGHRYLVNQNFCALTYKEDIFVYLPMRKIWKDIWVKWSEWLIASNLGFVFVKLSKDNWLSSLGLSHK